MITTKKPRKKTIPEEQAKQILEFYLTNEQNSVSKACRVFKVCHQRIKQMLIDKGVYRGVKPVSEYIRAAEKERREKPGKFTELYK